MTIPVIHHNDDDNETNANTTTDLVDVCVGVDNDDDAKRTIEDGETNKDENDKNDDDITGVTDGNDGDVDDDKNDQNEKQKRRFCRYCSIQKLLVGLVLLGFIVFVIVDSVTEKRIRSGLVWFLNWIETHVVEGIFAFILVYVIATIFMIPGSILTLGCGFILSAALQNNLWLGVALGTSAVFVGATLGAICAFLLGRYLFRDGFVGRLTEKYSVFEALDTALTEKGFRIMFLIRLSPIIPFNVINYVAGVTGIPFWQYVFASVGMIPGTALYVFLGASAGSLSEIGAGTGGEEEATDTEQEEEEESENKTVTIVVVVVGIVFGILAVALTSYYAKQELNKVIAKKEQEKEEENERQERPEELEAEEENAAAAADSDRAAHDLETGGAEEKKKDGGSQ